MNIYPKEMKTLTWKDIPKPMFTAVLLTTAKTQKQPKWPSMDEWMNKMWYTHTHTHRGILFKH